MTAATKPHQWRFFRSGGFDQVAIETAGDLHHLAELDPKLWTVLNCPTTGLEFDNRTLALMDGDGDGQIRVPEILSAVRWSCQRLTDASIMFASPGLPLAAIADQDAEGAGIKHAAELVLRYSDKTAEQSLQVADVLDTTRLFSADHFNGDGVVMPELTADESLKSVLLQIVETQGGVADRSGGLGVTQDTLTAFFSQAEAVISWHAAFAAEQSQLCPLADSTADAVAAFEAVQAKVDDYFVRCQLAAFDNRATDSLNPAPAVYEVLANRVVAGADQDIAALPLSVIAAERPLDLTLGINPAWAGAIASLKEKVLAPLLGADYEVLTAADWQQVSAKLAAWRSWQAAKPATALHALELAYLQQLLASDTKTRLEALIQDDLAASTFADNLLALEKLLRYQRDLVTLLRNFVSLSDFYQGEHKAIFQAGTLYLDQRSCELVMQVADQGRHATMAPFSGCYLVYCSCMRQGEAPINIVAALTGGDVDELMVAGRNGIFYDRKGRDWRATVTKVVAQPVSIRQAFWSPYKRVAAFIEGQIQKFAASRDKDIEAKTTSGVADAAAAPAAAPSNFDIAKFAGIFAAFGLALGALGTALAAIVAGLFSLSWWQIPLVLLGVMLLISAPSMLLAYLTLRRRNIGPLLDANGWAVNARAKINVPFGASLTGLAHLPKGAKRSLHDPFAEKKRPWALYLLLLIIVAVAAWYGYQRFVG
ncbi:hypothetical protein AGRI_05337 [Alishewanella agri BL06]|uniref:EF-hand domain-containing protein n=1 Tax=Alishewanella agri BL06 TaxID=1195246 RepID=I9P3U6_9ALTE|nr:hypothetical protein [Alishewanella agri]EIW89499.1 hypothetical protein AGRI_05337 [Alishewanella agri BL06]